MTALPGPPSRADLPSIVLEICDGYTALLEEARPGLLEGLYLHGSLGFGGEFHGSSDIDFVAVCSRRLTPDDLDVVRSVHADVIRRWPSPAFDGFYIVEADLTRNPMDVAEAPGIIHEWFSEEVHGDVKDITWRELRDHGVTVRGKERREIPIWSDDAALLAATRENLDTYWRSQLEAMEHHPREASLPQAAEWGGLGAPRLLHLLVTGAPTSKSGAGRWAIETFPQHRGILEEALRVRESPEIPSPYDDDPARRRTELIALMSEVIQAGTRDTP